MIKEVGIGKVDTLSMDYVLMLHQERLWSRKSCVLLNTTQISIHAFDEKMKPNVKIILDKQPTLKVTSLNNQPLTIVEETETASYLRNREKQTQLLNALGLNKPPDRFIN